MNDIINEKNAYLSADTCGRTYTAILEKPDYSKMYFIFNFKDGKQAKYRMDKDCNTLQAFLDRVEKYHESEERLAEASKKVEQLEKQLEEANHILWMIYNERYYLPDLEQEYIKKYGVEE